MGVTPGDVFELIRLVLSSFLAVVIKWMLLSWESKDFVVNAETGLVTF